MTFRDRLKVAAEEGILIGVKWALALAAILLTVSYLLNDYGIVRSRAANGQLAFEYLQKAQAAATAPKGP